MDKLFTYIHFVPRVLLGHPDSQLFNCLGNGIYLYLVFYFYGVKTFRGARLLPKDSGNGC